jgi:hypothetical protein
MLRAVSSAWHRVLAAQVLLDRLTSGSSMQVANDLATLSTSPVRSKHSSSTPLVLLLLLCHRDNIHRNAIKPHALQQILGIAINIQLTALGILGEVEGGDLGHVLIFALALFFLQFEGDATHGAALDALH